MNVKIKFSAVVVLYNPGGDVVDNIATYYGDVDRLYVIDNSVKKHKIIENIKKIDTDNKIEYVFFYGNKGIAAALNVALSKAKKEKYDYLMTMDQDTSFFPGDMKKYINLVKIWREKDRFVSFAANPEHKLNNEGVRYPKSLNTSSNIIDVKIAHALGGFKEELFIDEVDHEFCYRLINKGYKIVLFNEVKISHCIGEPRYKKLFFRKKPFVINVHNKIRRYYMVRNSLYIARHYPKFFFGEYKIYITNGLKSLLKLILIEDEKIENILYVLRAVSDFFKGKMGPYE